MARMGAVARWRALDWTDRRLVVESALVTAVAVACVRALGLRRALRATGAVRGRRLSADAVRRRAVAVDRAGRYVPGGTCLAQSLALAWMLRRRGVPAAVRLGVATDDGFAAHAWVEIDGTPLAGAGTRFAPLAVPGLQ